jgi:hypothetical protein
VTQKSGLRHEGKAFRWGWIYYVLAIPSTVLAIAATFSVVKDYSKTVAGAVAGAAALLTGLLAFSRAQEEAAAHNRAWARYRRLKEDAELFAGRARESADPSLEEEFKKLLDREKELAEGSPRMRPAGTRWWQFWRHRSTKE